MDFEIPVMCFKSSIWRYKIYIKKSAHGLHFLFCGGQFYQYHLGLHGKSCNCSNISEATMTNMGKYITEIS